MNYFSFLTTFQYSLTAGILSVKYRAFILPGSTWSAFGRCWSPFRLRKFSIKLTTFVGYNMFVHEHGVPEPRTCEILF